MSIPSSSHAVNGFNCRNQLLAEESRVVNLDVLPQVVGLIDKVGRPRRDHPPYTLHPRPYTLHPKPYTLHFTPYTLNLDILPQVDSTLGLRVIKKKKRVSG